LVLEDRRCRAASAKMIKRFATALFLAAWLTFVLAQLPPVERLAAGQAGEHVGECFTVCGLVASARYAETSRGSPTFLSLDRPFPQGALTVVIWGSERFKFGTPEVEFGGKRVCATGTISEYQQRPQIIAIRRRQVALEERSLEGRFYDRLMDSITCFRGF
jgi:hypothetical protein